MLFDSIELSALRAWFPNLWESIGPHFPQQKLAAESDAKYTLIGAASRTGKSYGAGEKFILKIGLDYFTLGLDKEVEYWAVAPNFNDCRAQKIEILRLVPHDMIDWAMQGDKTSFFDTTHGRGTLCLKGKRTIILKSAEKPEGLVAMKLRGIWWTEIARSKMAAWPNVYARLSNYPDSWLIADTSPLGHCWFYEEVWKKAKAGLFVGASTHEWKAVDSPYVPKSVIEQARQNLMPAFFKREFEASWDSFQGQIYDVDEALHIRAVCPFQPSWAVIAADVNTTSTHPAEFVWALCDGGPQYESRAWVEGAYGRVIGLDYDLYANDIQAKYSELKRRFRRVEVRIDPSFHNELKSKLVNRGVPIQNAMNDILPTIRMLGSALVDRPRKGPRLTFSEAARPAFQQIAAMKWVVDSKGIVKDSVDKALDDGYHDACRYMGDVAFPAWGNAAQLR